jgi:hypothetical protein
VRLVGFLIAIGVTLLVLSYLCPTLDYSYTTDGYLNPSEYRGYVVHCEGSLDIRIVSWEDEPFSFYFMTYENGLRTLEEGSLENVTVMREVSNITSLSEHLLVPNVGWYALLITPSTNETIEVFEVSFGRQIPNQGLALAGLLFIATGVLWFLVASRGHLPKLIRSNRESTHLKS